MTSFNAAGDHKFLQPTVSLIKSGFSMKTGTLQRHRKHLYQVQINLKKGGKNMHTRILFIRRNSKCGWWATILLRGKEHIFQHLAVFNVIMPRNTFPKTKSIANPHPIEEDSILIMFNSKQATWTYPTVTTGNRPSESAALALLLRVCGEKRCAVSLRVLIIVWI